MGKVGGLLGKDCGRTGEGIGRVGVVLKVMKEVVEGPKGWNGGGWMGGAKIEWPSLVWVVWRRSGRGSGEAIFEIGKLFLLISCCF